MRAAAAPDADLIAAVCEHAMRGDAAGDAAARGGAAAAIEHIAPLVTDAAAVLRLMEFVLESGLPDGDGSVRKAFVAAGGAVVEAHGASQQEALMPLIEKYLENRHHLPEALYDQVLALPHSPSSHCVCCCFMRSAALFCRPPWR